MPASFSPGSLVRARGREWVVQHGSTPDALTLRPLSGSDDDVALILPDLEPEPPSPALFPPPDSTRPGNHEGASLLRDAIHLRLRNGAGPFRSFGNIAVEPRAYQLVPLLMALRLPVVRLLIADDVGIGKTIEAGLIVRELLDRDEISRCAILCPPHLVEQWVSELESRFHLRSVALTSASAARLEKSLPPGASLFSQHPFVVVSLDYIKSERHREHFLSIAPEFVIVDEAHTCANGEGRQLRFELLQKLSAQEDRHLLLLTATPHSGDNDAFYNLLSLLRPEFSGLREDKHQRGTLREDLARHFVQRRRKDIEEWQDASVFPRRFTREITYRLTGQWGQFFDDVRDYCISLATRAEHSLGHQARMIWYATLAMLRCVSSSPAAAAKALETRLSSTSSPDTEDGTADGTDRVLDDTSSDFFLSDFEPAAALDDEALNLQTLIATARQLAGSAGDPKLAALISHLRDLLSDGFRPVVFCRYIATARYVAQHLAAAFKEVSVDAITGEYPADEREDRVAALGEAWTENKKPIILVATDCLSEGVNLQHWFTAVVHYDLAWNPSRHEQREGRVDRFGQEASEVRATMLYGQDNPVDGLILNVILRKAEAIRKELGILVPMPSDEQRINQALVKAALLKNRSSAASWAQHEFDFSDPALATLDSAWQDAMEKARANRTVFAQRRLRPDEVLPEWQKQQAFLGDPDAVRRFIQHAAARLGSPLEPFRNKASRLLPQHLPQSLRERLAHEGVTKPLAIDFNYPPVSGTRFIHRTHPLVSIFADSLVEDALAGSPHPIAARCAATVTSAVTIVTCLVILRLRHQLTFKRRSETRTLMAEECVTLAVAGRANPKWLDDADLLPLLAATPAANLAESAATREIQTALDFLASQSSFLESIARQRADSLLADHRRIRQAARDIGSYEVSPCLPVDILGVYVLLPADL